MAIAGEIPEMLMRVDDVERRRHRFVPVFFS
jgi:hypothetical protein